ncbi:MAG: AIR synthase related protein, partial [Actinomycetes bacterium]
WQDTVQADVPTAQRLPRPGTAAELRATLLRMVAAPGLAAKGWVTSQYDRYVLGNTVQAQPDDAGMVRIDERSGLGVALATDGNGRYSKLDPYEGARLALAEAYRNVAASGARPLAVTNCLNFGSPEDPAVMWQFAETVRGLADGCVELGVPVTGGNVSFYNQTGDVAILPTPVVGVLGVIGDVARRTPTGFEVGGDTVLLLGATGDELGGSAWAHEEHAHLGGRPPVADLARERALADVLVAGSAQGLLSAAHDVSAGGLAQTLVEMVLRHGIGARVQLPAGIDPFVALFSESAARAVVAVPSPAVDAVLASCANAGVPVERLGRTGGTALVVEGLFEVAVDELRPAAEGTFPALFG